MNDGMFLKSLIEFTSAQTDESTISKNGYDKANTGIATIALTIIQEPKHDS